jgi:hypothetical protein
MELFTATGKLKNFFWQLDRFDVYTTGDTAHVRTKYVPPLPRNLVALKARFILAVKNIDAHILTRVWQVLEYRIDVCRVTRGAHIEISSCQKTSFQFSCGCEQFH